MCRNKMLCRLRAVRFELDLFLKIRKVADQDINTPSIYLYLIIKYVRFPSLTKFLRLIYSITKLHITTYATDKFKKKLLCWIVPYKESSGSPVALPLWHSFVAHALAAQPSVCLCLKRFLFISTETTESSTLKKKTEAESSTLKKNRDRIVA
jgi:hypothetical protein